MKRFVSAAFLLFVGVVAHAADYSVYFQQKLPGGVPGFRSIIIDEPTSNSFYLYNLANHQPEQFTFDSSIVCNTTTHICSVPLTVGPAGPNGLTGSPGATGATGAAGVSPIVNRAVVTTSTAGAYTWTLPTACPTGQLPIVSITPEDSSATSVINPKITAKTNTTVTIQAMRTETQAVALIGLTVLTVPGTAVASTLHLMATCP